MRIAAHRGSRLHAPENTLVAYLSGYVEGADVIEMDVQMTADDVLVMSHDGSVKRMTGAEGQIPEMTLSDLRRLDFSRTFQPRNSKEFRYYQADARRLAIPLFRDVLESMPDDVELLVEMKHDSSVTAERRDRFVAQTVAALADRGLLSRCVLYSKDPQNVRLARRLVPQARCAAFDFELSPDEQFRLMEDLEADGLVTSLENVLDANGNLTALGNRLESRYREGNLRVGAVLYPSRTPGVFTQDEYRSLADRDFVWSLSTDSMIDVAAPRRRAVPLVEGERFAGQKLDTDRFALGYAKANPYCRVHQDDGLRVTIREYDGALPNPSDDPLEDRLRDIELKLTFSAKDWPYYSGGGLALKQGIRGDFVAEVDYTVIRVGQATTLEMAVLNVDPGAHRGSPPRSFRDKDSFYDPHGAPPYVGVEHDEDDGFRINWNLGSEYDNNQYGRPVGDGKSAWNGHTPQGARLRLARRGPYFAAYYRGDFDARDWVCVGAVRNDSLNRLVYLRCVAKRWRQEREDNPSEFHPILPNEYVFSNLSVTRFVNPDS